MTNSNETRIVKVLHVLGSLDIGGAETLVLNILRTINKTTFDCSVLVHERASNGYETEVSDLGCKIFNVETIKKLGIVRFLISLIRLFRKEQFDVIHIHTNYQSGVIAFAAFIAGVKIRIIHSHSGNWSRKIGIESTILLFFLRLLIIIFGNRYIACSKEAGDFLYPWTSKSRIIYLKNGIDIEKFTRYEDAERQKLRELYGISKNTFVIGHIGRFVEVKNHKFIVQLARTCKNKCDDSYKFLLVGEGPMKNEILKAVDAYNLYGNVNFLTPTKNITQYLNVFDCFILPSQYEGLPITIIEAQAVGIPCFVSNKVTRECDLGLGLIEFLDIKQDSDKWLESIKIAKDRLFLGRKRIEYSLRKNGFDIKCTTAIIEKIYQ